MKKALTHIHLLLEREDFNFIANEIVRYYKSKIPSGVKVRTTKYKDDTLKGEHDVDRKIIQIRTDYSKVSDFVISVLHEIKHAIDHKRLGTEDYKADYEWEMNYQIGKGKHQYNDNKFEIEAERWAQNEYRKFWKNKF